MDLPLEGGNVKATKFAAALAALTLIVPTASLAVPQLALVEGVLLSAGGGPVADGNYNVTFTYQDAAGATVWTEGAQPIAVKSGQFTAKLGAKSALPAAAFVKAVQLAVQVGSDPPLPASQLASVPLALRAGVAEELDCSGCIKAGHLDPAVTQGLVKSTDLQGFVKTADLGAYAKVADLGAFAKTSDLSAYAKASDFTDYVKASSLAKVAGTGSYSDLANLPVLAKLGASCGTGLVMKGIKADGSYECVAGGVDPSALPKDGLDEISNGLLTNQFTEIATSLKGPIDIEDAFPAGIADEIVVPDFGSAEALLISLDLVNSDISKVKVTVYDPQGKAYLLHDKTGSGTQLKSTWPAPTKLVSGDLGAWVGQNPKGKWSISVADFVGTSGAKEGKLNSWTIQVKTLSSKKVEVKGELQLSGALRLPVLSAPPVACSAATVGYTYMDATTAAVRVCRKGKWAAVLFQECGNGVVEFGEACDSGTGNADTADKCRTTCEKPKCGDAIKDSGEFCDDGNNKDGDTCPADCSDPNPNVVFTAVVTGSQSPQVVMGQIPGKAGKQIVIKKIGICGDSDSGSGPNTFSVSGAGLSFNWASGQSNPSPTHWLSPTPPKNASRGLTYADVNYTGQVGQSVNVSWDYHNDWDGHRCTDTDIFGNVYNDPTASSLRVWINYSYK